MRTSTKGDVYLATRVLTETCLTIWQARVPEKECSASSPKGFRNGALDKRVFILDTQRLVILTSIRRR